MPVQQRKWIAYALLLIAAFSFRFIVARYLPNDTPGDSQVYTQMARNLLEQHVYSDSGTPPYKPTLIRLPGYSIFLATVYAVFGHWNNSAVRSAQALLDTLTCMLVGVIAYYWEPEEKRKRATSIAALALAAICPFTTIYVATILTETWASLFAVALCLLGTLAFTAMRASEPRVATREGNKRSLWWWAAAGLIGGAGVFFRPDSGLFIAALGLTLVVSVLLQRKGERGTRVWQSRLFAVLTQGAVLSVAFAIVLVPWTVRNWREFHLFQPLSPTHGEMPGEFVPAGYQAWLRTWVDDRKYTESMLWLLNESEIDLDELPASAFDSAEERERVRVLMDQYNDPQDQDEDTGEQTESPAISESPSPAPDAAEPEGQTGSAVTLKTPSPEPDHQAKSSPANVQAVAEPAQAEKEPPPEMTPALDAGFGQIARERRARHPLRSYLWLPLKRARSLWFGPHADYYPFSGELLPLEDLDFKTHQQIWLPLFEGLVWIYTLLGIAGGWFLWRARDSDARRWLLLTFLLIFIRLGYFSTMENPEPRYTVEFFPFLAILGGIAISRLVKVRQT